MKTILKDIMAVENASLAAQYGGDATFLSNHGGRQLGAVSATIEVLPECRGCSKEGFNHSGWWYTIWHSHLQSTCSRGRPCSAWSPGTLGLAYNGLEGVETGMTILEQELSRTMALTGVRSPQEITKN